MHAKSKKIVLMLAIFAIIIGLLFTTMKVVTSINTSGNIDLYTQKEPYSGKGPNMPSDAFGPDETVILYALVTYNNVPVQNELVAFCVKTPNDDFFSFSAKTNNSGIASANFTVPKPHPNSSESEVFGNWKVVANVIIEGSAFQDSLTFKVDWIVKLISVRTIDQDLIYRSSFGIEGDVGVEITLRSIAMVIKSATIAVTIQDELLVPVSYYEINDFKVQPNEKLVYLYCKLSIPKWAYTGKATVFVSALTKEVDAKGVPYCPQVSSDFYILVIEPLRLSFHDVAVVEVATSGENVEVGQNVNITAVIQNEGTVNESFDVNAYFDDVLIETLPLTLTSHTSTLLVFTFETTSVAPGNYTITVAIPHLINEADLTDNVLLYGIIEVRPKLPPIIHDVAIVNVKVSNNSVYVGDLLFINVSVLNKGTEIETFTVECYYDLSLIGTLQVDSLTPSSQVTLTFLWNTSFTSEGFYQIIASALLQNDVNTLDNTFIDGIVQIKAKITPPLKQYYLTVNTNPSGIVTIPGEGWYDENNNVKLTAPDTVPITTGTRYKFSYWDVDGTPKPDNPINVLMDANHTATAHYIRQYYLTVRTNPPAIATLTGEGWYDAFSNVTLNALTVSNYIFNYWDIDGTSQGIGVSLITVFMDAPHIATAHYTEKKYMLTITTTAGGSTNPVPGTYEYSAGTTVNVAAVPNVNYVFDHWELDDEDIGSANPCSVMMNSNHTLMAVFSRAPAGWFIPEWILWPFLPFMILIILLLIALFFYYKRRKRAEASFYAGWTAWYYGYDLRGKVNR